ncbi:hypothetical protein BofuT4_P058640.1 [Botrytis cinerea T4]|uniref:Uncharacterized protein n=1 Tax=Botryotinia fuckeliana (strain T4) TaxID=999810 RepID=G2XUW4_BOTF4|nr:hypothetical protein BofuT4_P058640.1 [Botrytis cinerea T4]
MLSDHVYNNKRGLQHKQHNTIPGNSNLMCASPHPFILSYWAKRLRGWPLSSSFSSSCGHGPAADD